jgi:hypothetical protein
MKTAYTLLNSSVNQDDKQILLEDILSFGKGQEHPVLLLIDAQNALSYYNCYGNAQFNALYSAIENALDCEEFCSSLQCTRGYAPLKENMPDISNIKFHEETLFFVLVQNSVAGLKETELKSKLEQINIPNEDNIHCDSIYDFKNHLSFNRIKVKITQLALSEKSLDIYLSGKI